MRKHNGSYRNTSVILVVLFIALLLFLVVSPHGGMYELSSADESKQQKEAVRSEPVSAPSSAVSDEVRDDKPEEDASFSEKRVIHPLLHSQGLSHMIFHTVTFQEKLAAAIPEEFPRSVLIAGVEWGLDARHFAKIGYRVVAFEPMSTFFERLDRHFNSEEGVTVDGNRVNVSLFNLAAGKESGVLDLGYNYMKQASVPIVRIDDKVDEPISVLMADVQGNELEVLQGASKLLTSVQMIWVEAIACNPKLDPLLRFLDDEDFSIFDFVPFGRPIGQDPNVAPRERDNFLYNPERPSSFDSYLEWFCSSKSNFTMLQTDFVAVKRSLHPTVIPRLRTIGAEACQVNATDCVLRSHLL